MVREDVLARMVQANQLIDVSNPVYLQAEAVSSQPRVLDKAPKYIKLRRLDDSQHYGACNEFISMYASYKDSMNLEQGQIQMGSAVRYCDPNVFYALHCLGLSSMHCNSDRAQAAAYLFKLIMTTPGEVLTEKLVYERLQAIKKPEYFIGEFVKALRLCLFGGDTVVLYWMTLGNDHGYYRNASKLGASLIKDKGWDEKALKKELNAAYSEAKADAEFMKELYKPMCNKWMTAMIWLLKDSHPEAFDTTNSSDGFL